MAKRRNAKKEKAERNKVNARKYRKTTTRYSSRGRGNYNSNSDKDNSENEDNKTSSEKS